MAGNDDAKHLYKRLRDHYSAGDYYHLPARKELLQIIELRYTPEQAELALIMPVSGRGRATLKQLAEKSDKGEAELRHIIDDMLGKGLVFVQQGREGSEAVYCLWDLWYSLYTPLFGDGLDNDERRRLTDLREKLWQAGWIHTQFDSSYPMSRVMPFESGIDTATDVAPYERVSYYIDNAKAIAVVACGCRVSNHKCSRPVNNCIHFDRQAEYWVEYRQGRYLSKEECYQIINDSAKEGLVVTGANYQQMPDVFCNCCPDCCVLLRPYIENHSLYSIIRSNFIPQFNTEKCKPCLICQNACPVGAIGRHLSHDSIEPDDRMLVVEERCIGCGVCTAVCPREAVTLKKVRDAVPEMTRGEAFAKHLSERVW